MAKKTWTEKLNADKSPQIKTLEKRFADMPEGCNMFIATPQIIKNYVEQIPLGKSIDISTIRNDLAIQHGADKTCPVTTGIYLRIVSEAAFQDFQKGKKVEEISPFWRIVDPKSKLAKKLECGVEFIITQREREGIL